MKEVEAALFDMDGTLVDSIGVYEIVFDEIFRRLELSPIKEGLVGELMRQDKNPWEYLVTRMSFSRKTIIKAQEIDKEVFPLMYKRYARVFPAVVPLLSELKRRSIHTAIITSSWFEEGDPEPIQKLKGMVDVIVARFDTERHKPYPDPIFKACEKLHVAPEHAVYVGDSPLDIKAGKAAGTLTIGVLSGVSTWERMAREAPDRTVATFSELSQLIFS